MHNDVMIPRGWVDDRRLNLEQLGLLSYLCSFAEGYVFSVPEVVASSPAEGAPAALLSALGALKLYGYVQWDAPHAFTLCPRAVAPHAPQQGARS